MHDCFRDEDCLPGVPGLDDRKVQQDARARLTTAVFSAGPFSMIAVVAAAKFDI